METITDLKVEDKSILVIFNSSNLKIEKTNKMDYNLFEPGSKKLVSGHWTSYQQYW